ncbi:MAG TPA: hypothetical protein VGL15_15205 [Vicinamibacteria bacterium]
MKRSILALLCLLLLGAGGRAQDPPGDPTELINALFGGLLGFSEITGPELQKEVAEAGGVPFRADVPLDYMGRAELAKYLGEVLDAEYPEERARADQRTLVAFGMLDEGVDLRRLRARLLQENVAGFYDERPGKRRLYAVSEDRRLTPVNQIVLSHELRHALQDQYAPIHDLLPDSIGDFDDRRMALVSLLEGDATLVMERFLVRRIGGGVDQDLLGVAAPTPPVDGAPPVLRDQLVLPYIVGRTFAQALVKSGGWDAVKNAWSHPPESTEQVLHPEKFAAHESPRPVEPPYKAPSGRLVNDGVLGEVLTRTLLGEGSDAAAAGWGGDRYQVWDVTGKTLLVWRSVWDTPADAQEFMAAALAGARARYGAAQPRGPFSVFTAGAWRYAWGEREGGIELYSSDDPRLVDAAIAARSGS